MKLNIYSLILISILLFSCNNTDDNNSTNAANAEETLVNVDEAYDKIIEIEESVIGANNVVSNSKLMELKRACEDFDKNFYNDKRAESVLQKGIRASMSLKNYADAIVMMDKVIKNYGTDEKMPSLLFQKAFIYSESNWLGEADKLYSLIIKKYPNDPLAEQSKAAQELLFLTPEELNERFSKSE